MLHEVDKSIVREAVLRKEVDEAKISLLCLTVLTPLGTHEAGCECCPQIVQYFPT